MAKAMSPERHTTYVDRRQAERAESKIMHAARKAKHSERAAFRA